MIKLFPRRSFLFESKVFPGNNTLRRQARIHKHGRSIARLKKRKKEKKYAETMREASKAKELFILI
jgi:hypothetical protein